MRGDGVDVESEKIKTLIFKNNFLFSFEKLFIKTTMNDGGVRKMFAGPSLKEVRSI